MSITDYFPIGGVLPFGGEIVNSNIWVFCDGRQLNKNDYSELFDHIGYAYGGKNDYFNIPDYRGYFLRGVSGSSQNDPDANSRSSVNDYNPALPAAEKVGTFQDYATKKPAKIFKGNVPHLPYGSLSASDGAFGGRAQDDGSYNGETCNGGGDMETRPVNVYINYYIKARN